MVIVRLTEKEVVELTAVHPEAEADGALLLVET
jgi:hypothetical protein